MMKTPHTFPKIEASHNEEKPSILVVDDDPFVLEALETILKREDYEVYKATDGFNALQLIKQHSPAVIMCDQFMPGITGIEVLKQTQEMLPESIRILITAAVDSQTAIDAINVGHVNQYITKPWKNENLLRVVRDSLEKYKLIKENHFLQDLIFYQHQELQKSHDNLMEDLKLGASIHEQLLLGKLPHNIPGFNIDALSFPSKDIDGDFFEFYHPDSRFLDVVLGDVMGKGIAAALVGTAVKTQLIRFALPFPYQQFYDGQIGWHTTLLPPEDILSLVHSEICPELIELEYFVSLFYGRFDLNFKTFTFVDCGSAKPIHFHADEKSVRPLEGSSFPLGMVPENHYFSVTIPYQVGDIFVFYSDGVTEARAPDYSLFGYERLAQLVLRNNKLTPSELVHEIKEAIFAFSGKDKLNDDLTIVVVKIEPSNIISTFKTFSAEFQNDLEQLEAVRLFIKKICNQAPGDKERLTNELKLLINEAFCNIVKHATREKKGSGITITADLREQGIYIILSDSGIPFDPALVEEPNFCGKKDSGYGWQIIRGLADKLSYSPRKSLQDKNQLCIYKKYYIGDDHMRIKHEKVGDILIITPEGESLDARDASKFKELVLKLINENNSHEVICDLNQLQFIDSSGLGSMLSVLRELNSRGGDLKLSCMNKPIRTMFELVKMHKIFEIFNTTDEAVSSF
jgi:phosphoserine phosphatase RsbU/P